MKGASEGEAETFGCKTNNRVYSRIGIYDETCVKFRFSRRNFLTPGKNYSQSFREGALPELPGGLNG